jgi:uncharacterized protein (TIGR00375 family)
MKVIADLHLHSKYSRATSKDLNFDTLEKYSRIKGLTLLGTGDFTHPKWIKEAEENLKETISGSGIFKTKTGFPFVLQGEISLIYTQDNKGRRVHLVLLAPNFEVVKQINEFLLTKGRTDYDGRPIFKIPCPDFTEKMKSISKDIEIIPAHIWTPWFSIFGSESGFNTVEDCFKDQTKNIFALETGMSSDPEMNWRLSSLDKYSLISNSDSHSFWPWRMGRECNIFEMKELTYKNLIDSIRTKKGFIETIEVDPNYGKYHFDGHRNCSISFSPEETKKHNNICPVCKKKLTIGVLNRVDELADRPLGFVPKGAVPFKKIIPLSEILSSLLSSGIATQKVWKEYNNLLANFGNEFNILLDASKEQLMKFTSEKIADAIVQNRSGKIKIVPGYDGEYGYPVFSDEDIKAKKEIKISQPKIEENKKSQEKKVQKGLNEFI